MKNLIDPRDMQHALNHAHQLRSEAVYETIRALRRTISKRFHTIPNKHAVFNSKPSC